VPAQRLSKIVNPVDAGSLAMVPSMRRLSDTPVAPLNRCFVTWSRSSGSEIDEFSGPRREARRDL
jgi:hypothetical protein